MSGNLTRINNNQITDAISGNGYVGINANTKVQPYSITSVLLANNLTYGSDLTITGNLSVSGNVTAIDTTNVTIEDPLLLLASNQTGSPTVDIGYIGQRGTSNNIAFVWDESLSSFVTVFTDSGAGDNTNINILSYANLITGNANVTGNLSILGNVSIAGNIVSPLNISGNIATTGQISATGNISTANYIIGDGSYITNIVSTKISNGNSSANIGTSSGNLVVTIGNILVSTFYNNGVNFTGNVSVTGNAIAGNIVAVTDISALGNIVSNNAIKAVSLSLSGNVTSTLNVTGNVTANNVGSVNNVSAAGNITGTKIIASTTLTTVGNVYGGNIISNNNIFATAQISAAGNIITNQTFVGNSLTGNTLIITSTYAGLQFSVTGNINAGNTWITNVPNPINPTDVANKEYVDSLANGLQVKASSNVATTGNILTTTGQTYIYNNGASGVGATITFNSVGNVTIDTVLLTTGMRVLIKNEPLTAPTNGTTPSAAYNGIYNVTTAGSPSTALVLTRSTDDNTPTQMYSAYTFVTSPIGSVNNNTGWASTNTPTSVYSPIVVGTTFYIFAQFSQAGTYTAGNGLSLTGTQFNALYDGNTIGVNGSNQLYIPANAALTTPNIGDATGNSLRVIGNISSTGTVYANSLKTGNTLVSVGVSTSGNVTAANFTITGSPGNITGANSISSVTITATGNVGAGQYLFGDGAYISNINAANVSSTKITNGGSYANIASPNGNLVIAVGSSSNIVATFYNTGVSTVGNITTSGNLFGTAGSYIQPNFIQPNSTDPNWSFGVDGDGSSQFWMQAQFNGGQTNHGFRVYDNYANTYPFVVDGDSNVIAATQLVTPSVTSSSSLLNIGTTSVTSVAVNGGVANLIYVSGSTNAVAIGSNVLTTGATLAINATDSILLPVGNTAQRPGSPTQGMLRWSTTFSYLEVWNGTAWTEVGAPAFTVIQNEQFDGDGVTTAFTLASSQTTASCIVTINGIVQIPTTAYSVSGVYPTCVLTFTEAPLVGDIIDVREITTTTTVTSISNSNATAVVNVNDTSANVNIIGNLVVNSGNGFIYGDGTYLTNVGGGNVVASRIQSGNSQVNVATPGGEIYMAVGGSNVFDITSTQTTLWGNLNPNGNATQSLGNSTNQWSNLWISGNTIFIGGSNITANATTLSFGGAPVVTQNANGNISGGNITAISVSVSGNVTGSYLKGNGSTLTSITGGNVTGTVANATYATTAGSATTASTVIGNAQANITSVGILSSLSVTANITGGNLTVGTGTITVGNIVNSNANGVGNIGTSSNYFNTIFAKATSALYADLAELYLADSEYTPGTVVSFGGDFEITESSVNGDARVAGIVSTNPSYLMNSGLTGKNIVAVALQGRVPCRVTGTVRKGDMLVSNGDGSACVDENPKIGTVIGKSLVDFDGEIGIIEIVIGIR